MNQFSKYEKALGRETDMRSFELKGKEERTKLEKIV